MDFELKFTSAEAGVKRSAQGFCTVFATAGTPPPLVDRLESLSVYRHLFPAGPPGEERNPVAFSHVIVPVFGEPHHVLSRVQSAGLDYSKRFNYFAHHRVVDAENLPACGPAWLVGRPEVLQSAWDGVVATPPSCRPLVSRIVQPAVARYWQTVTGDSGWAGWVLERWQANPDGEAVFIVAPGDPVLELVQECVALLPTAARWRFTFSTYATKLPPDVECHLRFAVAGTPEAQARKAIDLRSLRGQSPPASPFIDAARQGKEVPIVLAARASGAGPRPAAAYKLSNLGELPPLPSEAARPTFRTDAGTTAPSGSTNKNILLIAVAAIFLMLCGAGYMFWDAQQRTDQAIKRAEGDAAEKANATSQERLSAKENGVAFDSSSKKEAPLVDGKDRRTHSSIPTDSQKNGSLIKRGNQGDKSTSHDHATSDPGKRDINPTSSSDPAKPRQASKPKSDASATPKPTEPKDGPINFEQGRVSYLDQPMPGPPTVADTSSEVVPLKVLAFRPARMTLHQFRKRFEVVEESNTKLIIKSSPGVSLSVDLAELVLDGESLGIRWHKRISQSEAAHRNLEVCVLSLKSPERNGEHQYLALRVEPPKVPSFSMHSCLKPPFSDVELKDVKHSHLQSYQKLSSQASDGLRQDDSREWGSVKQQLQKHFEVSTEVKLRIDGINDGDEKCKHVVTDKRTEDIAATYTCEYGETPFVVNITLDHKRPWFPVVAATPISVQSLQKALREQEKEQVKNESENKNKRDSDAKKAREEALKDDRRVLANRDKQLLNIRKFLNRRLVGALYYETPVSEGKIPIEVIRFGSKDELKREKK